MIYLSNSEFENLKLVLGEMYLKFGSTDEVIKLSQIIDTLVLHNQKKRIFKN